MSEKKEAGRELDAEIAERVMGLVVGKVSQLRYVRMGNTVHPSHVPHYSTDIAAAWEVVERMRERPDPRFRTLRLVAYSYNRTYATFDFQNEDDWTEANGPHATPLAICLAALEALSATT